MDGQMTDGWMYFGTMTFRTILWGQETVCHTSRKRTGRGKSEGRAGSAPRLVGMESFGTDRPPGRIGSKIKAAMSR